MKTGAYTCIASHTNHMKIHEELLGAAAITELARSLPSTGGRVLAGLTATVELFFSLRVKGSISIRLIFRLYLFATSAGSVFLKSSHFAVVTKMATAMRVTSLRQNLK